MTRLSDIYGNFFLGVDYVKVSDVKAYNVDGGTFTQAAWRTRDINTEDSDASSICSISSNQITLEAGTYVFKALAPAAAVDRHVLRLYNISDTAVVLLGNSTRALIATNTMNFAHVSGKFTIAAQKTFEIQHYCTTTVATAGLGFKSNVSGIDSIYTAAEFWRVAT